jgi:hypothetical protein
MKTCPKCNGFIHNNACKFQNANIVGDYWAKEKMETFHEKVQQTQNIRIYS